MSGGINVNPDFSDVVNNTYVTGSVSVGTTEIEAKVGGSPVDDRQIVTIHNKGPKEIFYGPTGLTSSTGTPLKKNQFACIPVGPDISVFMLTASSSSTVIVQEYA